MHESDQELGTLLSAVDRARLPAAKPAAVVAPQPQSVMFVGQIRKPGSVPIAVNGELPLTEALALAGGVTDVADRHVVITHRQPDGTVTKETVDLSRIQPGLIAEPKLLPTDIVFVAGRTK